MPFPSFDQLSAFPAAAAAQLEQFASYLLGYLTAEHKDDGTHGAVTADSVTTPALTATAITASGETINGNETINGALSVNGTVTVAHGTDTSLTPVTINTIGSTATDAVVIGGDVVTLQLVSMVVGVPTSQVRVSWGNGRIVFRSLTAGVNHGGLVVLDDTGASLGSITAAIGGVGGITSAAGFVERGRSVAVGEWTNVTFNAGDFVGDVGTWTVGAGDVSVFKYTLIGKTMILTITLNTTTVATAPNALRVTIPGGFTSVGNTQTGAGLCTDNGTVVPCYLRAPAGATFVQFVKTSGATFANATDNTTMSGQIAFEVA